MEDVDVADVFEPIPIPSEKITIIYNDTRTVELGQELTPAEVRNEPVLKWKHDSSQFYTILMLDPDSPSRTQSLHVSPYNHWLVANIKGCDLSSGEVIYEYVSPKPPEDGGLHRYIFILFEHKDKLTFDAKRITKDDNWPRVRFFLHRFMKLHNLDDMGIYAFNYFTAQWHSEYEWMTRCLIL